VKARRCESGRKRRVNQAVREMRFAKWCGPSHEAREKEQNGKDRADGAPRYAIFRIESLIIGELVLINRYLYRSIFDNRFLQITS
jgi:hypothetical protein